MLQIPQMQSSPPSLAQGDRVGDLRALVSIDAAELSARLRAQQLRDFPPSALKTMRRFSPPEAARFLGITEGYLRQLIADGKGPAAGRNGRRTYSLDDVEALRSDLARGGKGTRSYLPHRKADDHLQIV